MSNSITNRLKLLDAYFDKGRNFNFRFLEVVSGMLKRPCTSLGPKFIESIDVQEEYAKVKIHNLKRPLCWPSDLPLFDLYKVVTECFYEADWHFYEVAETRVEQGDVVLGLCRKSGH
jgi:hypothetical protein